MFLQLKNVAISVNFWAISEIFTNLRSAFDSGSDKHLKTIVASTLESVQDLLGLVGFWLSYTIFLFRFAKFYLIVKKHCVGIFKKKISIHYLRELVHCLTMSWHYLSIMNDYQIGPGPELKWRFLYLQHWLIQKNVRHHDLKKQYSIILRKIDFFSTVNKYINT